MDCQDVKNKLSVYIDGDPDKEQASLVEDHLRGCQICSYEYRRMLKAWETLDLWEDAEPPAYLRKSILYRIKKEKTVKSLKVLIPAAAVLIITAGIFLFYEGSGLKDEKGLITKTQEPLFQAKKDAEEVNEEEIISNLHILQEKDFYDSLDILKKIDYLPLVEEPYENKDNEKSSFLESLSV